MLNVKSHNTLQSIKMIQNNWMQKDFDLIMLYCLYLHYDKNKNNISKNKLSLKSTPIILKLNQ